MERTLVSLHTVSIGIVERIPPTADGDKKESEIALENLTLLTVDKTDGLEFPMHLDLTKKVDIRLRVRV